jgi:A1 cistron-splicing factor AAR2
MDFLFHQDIIHNQSLLHMAPGAVEGNDTTPLILSLLNLDPEAGTPKPPPAPVDTILPRQTSPLSPARSADTMLAEFQGTFLTGLHLGNHACIEQWWNLLLKVILPAQRLISLRPDLVASLLTVFYTQMVYNDKYVDHAVVDPSTSAAAAHTGTAHATSASMLDTIPRNTSRLKRALTVYRDRIEGASRKEGDAPELMRLMEVFRLLEEWFVKHRWDLVDDGPTEEYGSRQERDTRLTRGVGGEELREETDGGYDSEDETGEYAPVFVELDEDGREVGTVRWD